MALVGQTYLYAATNNNVYVGTITASDNGSISSWTPSTLNNVYVTQLFYDTVGNVLYAGTAGQGVYAMNLATPNEWISLGLNNMNITSLFVQNNTLFVGTHANGIYSLSVATQNKNWTNVYQSSVAITGFSEGYFLSPTQISLVASTLGQGVIVSPDDGVTWQNLGGTGLSNVNILTIYGGLVGTAGGGMYGYSPSDQSWTAYGPTGMNITSIITDGNVEQGVLLVSTQGNGILLNN